MFERTVDSDDLVRLKQERENADRLYNEMLTALDAAVQRVREMPALPLHDDQPDITPLSERWELLSLRPAERGGWLARLRAQIWSMVSPLFERQQAFNAALIDHLSRNVAAQREAVSVIAASLNVLREEHEKLVDFQSSLVVFAQQITPYVDTKDREVAGLLKRLNEDVGQAANDLRGLWDMGDRRYWDTVETLDQLNRMNRSLNQRLDRSLDELNRSLAGVSGVCGAVNDEVQKRYESALARERRLDARLDAEFADLRTTVGMVQRASQALKRELERVPAAGADASAPSAPDTPPSGPSAQTPARRLDSYKYVGFEDQFRGSQEDIRERQKVYLPLFEGASNVLDVGCGRGEFLDLLRERGITARGVDLNDEMAAVCRARGLDATTGDALTYLLGLPDASLGGLFAAQVVEHLEPDYLMRLLEAAYHKLRPGARIVLETINAACWYAFFSSFIRDITHVQPLHPDTLSYLLVASGFQRVEIRYSAPFPDELKLQTVPSPAETTVDGSPPDLVAVVNENVGRLNNLLFTYLDYAAIGERL